MRLLLEQAGMAGNALPLAEVENPGISEAADMIIWLATVSPRRVINPGDHGRVAEEIHFQVLNISQRGLEERVLDVGKESLLVAEFAIPFGVDEAAGNQGVESRGIPIHLSFIPQALQNQQFAFPRISMLSGGHSGRGEKQETTDRADHARTRPPASPREANVSKQ